MFSSAGNILDEDYVVTQQKGFFLKKNLPFMFKCFSWTNIFFTPCCVPVFLTRYMSFYFPKCKCVTSSIFCEERWMLCLACLCCLLCQSIATHLHRSSAFSLCLTSSASCLSSMLLCCTWISREVLELCHTVKFSWLNRDTQIWNSEVQQQREFSQSDGCHGHI